jgi:hypothetical protein
MVNNIEILRLKTIIRKNNIIEKENKNKNIIAVNIVANFYNWIKFTDFKLFH